MTADELGLELQQSGSVQQEALWFELMKALGAGNDAEVGQRLPPKDMYEAGGALVFFQALGIVGNGKFVQPLDAWVKHAMAWGTRFKAFVAVADDADPSTKDAVSFASREILARWQILSDKGWVSGYSYSDETAEDIRRFVRDNGPDALKLGLVLVLAAVILIAALAFRPR